MIACTFVSHYSLKLRALFMLGISYKYKQNRKVVVLTDLARREYCLLHPLVVDEEKE